MKVLPLSFKFLTFFGCWKPISWSSRCTTIVYNIYSLFIAFLVISFLLSEIGDVFNIDTVDEFTENCYLLFTLFAGCCKMMNMLFYRKDVIAFIDILGKAPCIPNDIREIKIEKKYDDLIHANTLQYALMIETTVVSHILNTLIVDLKHGELPYRAWMPYDYTSAILFYVTCFYQLLSVTIASLIHVAADTLLFGMLVKMCYQIDILKHRLKNIKHEEGSNLRETIRHHNCIYRLCTMITEIFKMTIVSQFLFSGLGLCMSLNELLKNDLFSLRFLSLFLYMCTLLTQIFIYCWYGNEVKLKSLELSDSIFQIDWINLSHKGQKALLLTMKRVGTPIEFGGAYIVTMDLETFMALIKTSYSAYSILQTGRK